MLNQKEYQQKYRIRHREEMGRQKQGYYLQHREKINAHCREYYLQHSEEIKTRRREYMKKYGNSKLRKKRHAEGINIKFNLMLGISYTPEYQSMKRVNRRVRFKNAGELTLKTIQQVYDENIISNGGVLKCIYCSKELTKKEATLEHKQPLSRGGTNDKGNLAITCEYCNKGKRDKTEAEFREYIKERN